jgi:hypothetical protein
MIIPQSILCAHHASGADAILFQVLNVKPMPSRVVLLERNATSEFLAVLCLPHPKMLHQFIDNGCQLRLYHL